MTLCISFLYDHAFNILDVKSVKKINISGIKTANVFNLVIQETNNFTEEDLEAYKYALCQSGRSGPINYYRKIFASDLPRGHTRTKIKAPTLVVWVGNTSPQQAQRTRVLCLGPLTTPHAMHVYISHSISGQIYQLCTQSSPEVYF